MVVGLFVIAVVIGAFVLKGYANWAVLGAWQDIFKLYDDVLKADRKRRAEEAARKRDC